MALARPAHTRPLRFLLALALAVAAATHCLPQVAAASAGGSASNHGVPHPDYTPETAASGSGAAAPSGNNNNTQAPLLQLELPPDRNAAGQPVLTPTRAEVAGRILYYEVPQV